jgi:hypothetical protein
LPAERSKGAPLDDRLSSHFSAPDPRTG